MKYSKLNSELFVFLIIILVSVFLRFYKLDQYMTFLGDEGRDAIVVKKILTEGDIPFIGPPMSVGNIYLGPLFYYMMAIPMAIFWLNPVAAAGMVALIGTLTVGLIYYLSRKFFGTVPAIVSSTLYSVSFVTTLYSRSSWNPNPAPFFALIGMAAMYRAFESHSYKWFILTAAAAAFAVQMHYIALSLIPIYLTLWIYQYFLDGKKDQRSFMVCSLLSLVVFILLMSPLVLFDLKHNFMNFYAFKEIFFSQDSSVTINSGTFFVKLFNTYTQSLVSRFLAGENLFLTIILSITITLPIIYFLHQRFLNKISVEKIWPFFALSLWLILGLLFSSLYKGPIYDHYLGFLNPAAFLLVGALFYMILKIKDSLVRKVTLSVASIFVIFAVILNISKNQLFSSPNMQLQRTQNISKFIISKSEQKDFNFALIAEHNYDAAYQYYLDIYGQKPKIVPFDVTDQLFVVCEDPICHPVGHPKQEIAAFGWTVIDSEYELNGVKLYKLIHNPLQPKI